MVYQPDACPGRIGGLAQHFGCEAKRGGEQEDPLGPDRDASGFGPAYVPLRDAVVVHVRHLLGKLGLGPSSRVARQDEHGGIREQLLLITHGPPPSLTSLNSTEGTRFYPSKYSVRDP